MSANQAHFPIAVMARVLGVSKAGYYAWSGRPLSARAQADEVLLRRIRTIHLGSRQIYGSPRVQAELRDQGETHSRKRIARLMRQAGLVGACHRRGGPVTTRRDQAARPAPDLVDRSFAAHEPNWLYNAMAESFFSTLECELLARRRFQSRPEARMALFSYLEGFYNPVRRHSALGYRSPLVYQQEHRPKPATETLLSQAP